MGNKVRVLFVPHHGAAAAEREPLREWKRRAVWGNAGRNELVAGVAAGLAERPVKTLRELGAGAGVRLPGRAERRVVVLAETAEHARRLAELLPGWEVMDAIPTGRNTVGPRDEPGADDSKRDAIATLVYAARNGVSCDALVRATAGTGGLNWNSFRAGAGDPGTAPALLVDVADESCGRMRTDSEARRREYREQKLKGAAAARSRSKSRNT